MVELLIPGIRPAKKHPHHHPSSSAISLLSSNPPRQIPPQPRLRHPERVEPAGFAGEEEFIERQDINPPHFGSSGEEMVVDGENMEAGAEAATEEYRDAGMEVECCG